MQGFGGLGSEVMDLYASAGVPSVGACVGHPDCQLGTSVFFVVVLSPRLAFFR
jgi:hypothetical protein